uniref:Uncharacterized protein n=1 Tax=Tanacetum cinerariifolium TaxID=118510 RepID=A0A6L2N8K6_TANCI|nr:hypothetical protein [Tanacetum cinerariifolium]
MDHVRPMIPNLDDTQKQILEPLSKMTRRNKKQYIVDVKVMNYLLQAISNDIYNSVDACKKAKEIWERIKRLMFGYDVTSHVRHSRLMDKFDNIMGEPLSPDSVFDFPVDESEPHPAYDFFAPGPLPGYDGNPNNNNECIEADVPLLGELEVVADEPMDIAMLFGDDDFKDDDSEGFDEDEVWEVNEEWLMASVTQPLMPAVPPPSVYEVGTQVEQGQHTATQRDEVITRLTQQCILGMDRRLADLERRPPGPQ